MPYLMCGICGVYNFNHSHVTEKQIQNMMKLIKHRGPDDEGIYINENIGFGFVRLSIIDLSPAGHQPMYSDDGRFVIVYNGEIYNYIELRNDLENKGYSFHTNSDTEVLLNSYLEWGEDCLHRFNGMWAFAIYDIKNKSIWGSRDRFGVKPLYYYTNNNTFVFSSEIPPIVKTVNTKFVPNFSSVSDYLRYNRTDLTEQTFFEDINKIPPGFKFALSPSGIVYIKPWYRIEDNLKKPFESFSSYYETLVSAIQLRLRSDVKVGVCLSGGIDSSSIYSIIKHELGNQDIRSFSGVYGENVKTDESKFIRCLSDDKQNMFFTRVGLGDFVHDIRQFVISQGEPVPSGGPYISYKVFELAQKNCVVLLNGQGADEQLAGYHYFWGIYLKEMLLKHKVSIAFRELYTLSINHLGGYAVKLLVANIFKVYLLDNLFHRNARYYNKTNIIMNKMNSKIIRDLYWNNDLNSSLISHFKYKLEHLLKWEDRNSMAFSLESRVPFLDYRLVERTLSLPSEMIMKDGYTKYILRNAVKHIVPTNIVNRYDKIGFGSPIAEWFRSKEFFDFYRREISDLHDLMPQIFNTKYFQDIYESHKSGKRNNAKLIWKIISMNIWLKEFCNV